VVVVRAAWATALLAGLLACAGAERTPAQTVERYLDALAADPVRSLELLTPAFHTRHGLRFEEVADRPFAAPAARRPTPSGDASLELERARLGWLTVLTKRIFALQSPRFRRRVVSEEIRGDAAQVELVVEPSGLHARFALRREAGEPWRIDAVVLPPVSDAQLVAAFLIAPNAELHRRIAERRASTGTSGPPPTRQSGPCEPSAPDPILRAAPEEATAREALLRTALALQRQGTDRPGREGDRLRTRRGALRSRQGL
jgi:hypothetical protein